jgi:CheY-like chemotaxis protein
MEERLKSTRKGPLNIVLADDDSDDRDLFQEAATFVEPSIKIIMTRDGEELMDVLTKGNTKPDLIFLDLNMPKKNGKECLIEIQEDISLNNIPVIIYTTSLNQLDIQETFEIGAKYFLRKPNSFEELKEILRRTLKIKFSEPRTKDAFVLNRENKMVLK